MNDYKLEYVRPWLRIHGPKWNVATQHLSAVHSKREQVLTLPKGAPSEVIDWGDHYQAKDFALYVYTSSVEGHDSFAWLKSGACRLYLPMDVAHMIVERLAITEAE